MKTNRPYWQVALRLMFSILATVAFIIIGWKLLGFFIPFVVGWIIAAIAAPLVNWLEKRLKIVKKLGSALIVIVVLAAIVLALYFGISRLAAEISSLIRNFPEMYAQAGNRTCARSEKHCQAFLNGFRKAYRTGGLLWWRIWISIWGIWCLRSASRRSRRLEILPGECRTI